GRAAPLAGGRLSRLVVPPQRRGGPLGPRGLEGEGALGLPMKVLIRWFSRGRVRGAKRRLASDPSARHYVDLAHEYALAGDPAAALRVAGEGLRAYPGYDELRRLSDRVRHLSL